MSKKKYLSVLFFISFLIYPVSGQNHTNLYEVDIRANAQTKNLKTFALGTSKNPKGEIIQVNSNSFLFNGKPQLPVMGEIHFSRIKENEWRRELLKMEAGGVKIVSTYVFWIHHEEEEGMFNWEGQRNLRRFLEICKELNFPVILRMGPWCHGEVRNGGFPEWLVKSGIKLRGDNPGYLNKVQKWYSQIFTQARGLLWKDGGPVIGIQLENEYRGRGTHLMTLKKMAVDLGFDVPVYTRTGWPKLTTPVSYGEILPLYGDYADGFWDRSTGEMPGDYSKSYTFRSFRNSTVIATEQLPKQSVSDNPDYFAYPYLTCELGGGMMTSYHRRINIAPMDVYAMTLVRVGSGSNLPGYYMYHGGNNPDGKLTTMNEQQASSYTNYNDLPVESYDFQAPLGEFGQINGQYHLLRKLHIFLKDFGSELAMMTPQFPGKAEMDPKRDSLLRWSVRSNGYSGYIFVNNYQRLKPLSLKSNIQFSVKTSGETLNLPELPITVPRGESFFIPFNMDLEGARLIYATAQPIAKLEEGGNLTYVFSQMEGIPTEFVFDSKNISVKSSTGNQKSVNSKIYFRGLETGTSPALQLRTPANRTITIILLNDKTSLKIWKGEFAGKERLFLTDSGLTFQKNQLQLENSGDEFNLSIFPVVKLLTYNGKKLRSAKDGIFSKYKIRKVKTKPIRVDLEKINDFGVPLRTVATGSHNVAEMPGDSDFLKAANWKITLPENQEKTRDITLRITYKGDVARVYSGNKLLTDNFFNGKPFDVNISYFSDEMRNNLINLKILPLKKDVPIYFPREAGIKFGDSDYLLESPKMEIIENRTILLNAK
ncbi:MAG: beta-galactosidase [Paludibacteraceae bacterium]